MSPEKRRYIQKWNKEPKKELDRLAAMDTSSLQGEKKQWAGQRQGLLKALLKLAAAAAADWAGVTKCNCQVL